MEDYQKLYIFSFTEDQLESLCPEGALLVLQIVFGLLLILILCRNRAKNPIIQNSPITTILAQVALIINSVCLLLCKIVLINNGSTNQQEKQCQVDKTNWQMITISLVYTFCLQFVFASFFVKMLRVLLVCLIQNKLTRFFVKVLGKQTGLVIFAIAWSALIVGIDILFKFQNSCDSGKSCIKLTPQLIQFMCDETFPKQFTDIKIRFFLYAFWYGRQAIMLSLFIWGFIISFRLQQLDDDLKIRKQNCILLFLPLAIMFGEKILILIKQNESTAMIIHYINCAQNFSVTIFFFFLFCNKAKDTELFLPNEHDLLGHIDKYYIFSRPDSRQILRQFLQGRNKKKLYQLHIKRMQRSYNHREFRKQKLNQILEAIEGQQQGGQILYISNNPQRKFQKANQIFDKILYREIQEWQKTQSALALNNKWSQFNKYYKIMVTLKLVKQVKIETSKISQSQSSSIND